MTDVEVGSRKPRKAAKEKAKGPIDAFYERGIYCIVAPYEADLLIQVLRALRIMPLQKTLICCSDVRKSY